MDRNLEDVLAAVRAEEGMDHTTHVNAALIRLMWESHKSLERRVNGLYVLIIASVGAIIGIFI